MLLALRQLAQSNASLLLRRGGQANAAIEHLAQAAPPLERRRLTSTYAPAGAVNAGTPLTRVLGRA